ncbi:helix-turn-helix domain-containing protein [Humibacter sp.]|uniref:helix-turn-helix domain-containing protein n=1 Tax=Humibacter sp. TaxID=1940291 RepID=UPI003F7DFD8C
MSDQPNDRVERFDTAGLAQLLRERRSRLSLRQAAAEAGVSFSTFSRVEGGSQPDLVSFTKLCAWLGLPPSQFFTPVAQRETDPIDSVITHLYEDRRLTQENASKIGSVLRDLYNALAAPAPESIFVACHLRAAPLLRPGVSERLSSALSDMENELERLVAVGEL